MARANESNPNRSKVLLVLIALAAAALIVWGAQSRGGRDGDIGKAAMEQASALVALGPRPSGSEAHRKMQGHIIEKLRSANLAVEEDRFDGDTPDGAVPMNNIIGKISGGAGAHRTIVLATHYDTKPEKNFQFVGANDGASGTGLLLALAPVLAKKRLDHEIWLVFLDGEEAFHEWTATDSLYGSRHLAEKLAAGGKSKEIGAFILLDMVGDASLGILKDQNSTPWLRDLIWKAAERTGNAKYFLDSGSAMEDDHIPMIKAGIPSVDLIDFDYPPWHTSDDTIDKIGSASLQVVAEVVLAALDDLDSAK